MPHYFFHQRGPDSYIADEEGRDLPNIEAVRAGAISAARDILVERIRSGHTGFQKFEITDAHGDVVLMLDFKEALTRQ